MVMSGGEVIKPEPTPAELAVIAERQSMAVSEEIEKAKAAKREEIGKLTRDIAAWQDSATQLQKRIDDAGVLLQKAQDALDGLENQFPAV